MDALRNEPASSSALGDLESFIEDVRMEAIAAGKAIAASTPKKVVVLDSYDAALFPPRV